MEGLSIAGNKLLVDKKPLQVKASSYIITSNSSSSVSEAQIANYQERDSLQMTASQISFSTNLNDLLANNLHLEDVQMQNPVVKISRWSETNKQRTSKKKFSFQIDRLTANSPEVNISLHGATL